MRIPANKPSKTARWAERKHERILSEQHYRDFLPKHIERKMEKRIPPPPPDSEPMIAGILLFPGHLGSKVTVTNKNNMYYNLTGKLTGWNRHYAYIRDGAYTISVGLSDLSWFDQHRSTATAEPTSEPIKPCPNCASGKPLLTGGTCPVCYGEGEILDEAKSQDMLLDKLSDNPEALIAYLRKVSRAI